MLIKVFLCTFTLSGFVCKVKATHVVL